MNRYKTLGYKILLLIVLLVGLNYIYKYTFYEQDIQTHSSVINLVRNVVQQKDEIIYLGESSNITFREDDIDKRAISDFIGDYFPSKKVGSITKEASHAGIYYELLRNIPEKSSVKTVIVTLNLRSFNANWIYSNLETPLQKSIVLLKPYPPLYNRLLLTFRGYDIKTDAEREVQFKDKWKKDILKFPKPFPYNNVIDWDAGMAAKGIKNGDGLINVPLTELACHYIKTYAFQIDPLTNPRIKDFDKIVHLAKERNWKLVFNLMAENTEMADSLVGKELIYLMKQNRDLLKKRYESTTTIVVDNFESIPDSEYIDRNWTTEHYAENGRKIIAENVAEKLKRLYPKAYKSVAFSNTKPFDFFNDCDGSLPWGQMYTLSSEKSYSGGKSSKTGQKQAFSITFEYPIKSLPDSLKQVSIDLKVFQTGINPDIKLVIELSGKDINYQWNGIPISDLSRKTQKWDEINYIYTLPKEFHQGDLIKIFVYNPTNRITYIDDLKIKFKR
ncbi:hypothetical protein [Fluviicola taffensis]|uniref:DUF4843 domain-containing protein n=1 Tax=Fluviicola taffensis (strain DSM 16823 / NCIMB 13979 / RW262) TaxID=755732 RepID=F2IE80_FLUTR|nr:hypothetical protein [Fluviicola taffensis]AEA42398.1 hypothetical protein Fluta_0390 [Fluviicola taffensis DSM 16823]